jgi:hypothetical protein
MQTVAAGIAGGEFHTFNAQATVDTLVSALSSWVFADIQAKQVDRDLRVEQAFELLIRALCRRAEGAS